MELQGRDCVPEVTSALCTDLIQLGLTYGCHVWAVAPDNRDAFESANLSKDISNHQVRRSVEEKLLNSWMIEHFSAEYSPEKGPCDLT